MDPDSVVPPDGPELMRRRKGWWCGWRRRIPLGAMIASWVPWPILASGYRTRRWVISCADTESLLPPNESTRPAGKGTDFFTVEVLTLKGLVTYYVLFFIQSRPCSLPL